jgi:uncharacterized protein
METKNSTKDNKGFINSSLNAVMYESQTKKLALVIKFCLTLLFSGSISPSFAQSEYHLRLAAHRDSINQVFADPEKSILPKDELAHFTSLTFYEPDSSYKVIAKFKRIKKANAVKMKTSGTRTPLYKPYGLLKFKLNGKKCSLTLYQNAEPNRPELKNYLLLAFTDLTNGFDTYGGGRYLDYRTDQITKNVVIDFNYCYNPYCAYADKFNCVIPPAENNLPIKIEAGVKKFHE